jgi:hypothetical protein
LKDWTTRDWTSVICGWIGGMIAVEVIPESGYKLVLVFFAGFCVAWAIRGLIPR